MPLEEFNVQKTGHGLKIEFFFEFLNLACLVYFYFQEDKRNNLKMEEKLSCLISLSGNSPDFIYHKEYRKEIEKKTKKTENVHRSH